MGNPQPPYLVYSLWVLLDCISTSLAALKPFDSPVSTDRQNRPIVSLLKMAFDISEILCPYFFFDSEILASLGFLCESRYLDLVISS